MKKRIVFSSYDDIKNPFYGGGGARSIHEIGSKISSKYDITVITGNYKGAKNEKVNNVSYKRIGPAFLGPRIGQLLFHALLPFYVLREKHDLWIESFTPPFSTSFLQLFTKKPVIGLVHMLSSEDMQRKYGLPFHLIEEQGLKTYKHFIVLTEAFKKKIEEQNPNANIAVIPNGVDKRVKGKGERGKNSSPRDHASQGLTLNALPFTLNPSPYILYIGRIEVDQKGLDLLIDAYKNIAAKTSVKLVIAGSGCPDDERALEKLIRDADLGDKIVLAGRVSGVKKDTLLRDSLAVVIPSRFETFGVVALEAMSYGKPLVHFALEGLQWIPQDCSIKVKPFSTKDLGSAMEKVLTDKSLRQKLSAASKKEVAKYSWATIVGKYEKVLEKILKEYE